MQTDAMQTDKRMLIDLENSFWQSMVDEDTEMAVSMLSEPALMVSAHGAMKFDHAGYRQMATHGSRVLKSFELSNVDVLFPTQDLAVLTYRARQSMAPRGGDTLTTEEMADSSTWVRKDGRWQCVMHTETPVPADAEPVARELARSRTLLRHEA